MRHTTLLIATAITLCSCTGIGSKEQPTQTPQENITETTTSNEQQGTNFRDIPTLAQALETAKQENKLLFIECHIKTCGPCHMMMKDVFPLKQVGDYLNEHFVSISRDMEEGDGLEIGKKYEVGIYPTYLIIDNNGNKVGEVLGADKNVDEFLEKIKTASGKR